MPKMTLTKEYQAPIQKVWDALTTPELIKQFWAPPGMQCVEASIDKLEKDGVFKYSMKNDEGFQQWVKCVYQEVDPPHTLTFLETITDKDGNEVPPSAMGMPGDEIKHHLTELKLSEEDGVTTVAMTIDYGDDQSNQYASGGWNGMLANLAEVVE